MNAILAPRNLCLPVLLLLVGCQQMALDKLGRAGAEWAPADGASFDVSFDDHPEELNDQVLKSLIDELDTVRTDYLTVNDSAVSDASVPYLLRLDTLRYLDVCGTQITRDGVRLLLSNQRLRRISVDTSQVPPSITEQEVGRLRVLARDRVGVWRPLDWEEFQSEHSRGR